MREAHFTTSVVFFGPFCLFATRVPNRQLLLMLNFSSYVCLTLLNHNWRGSFKSVLIIPL